MSRQYRTAVVVFPLLVASLAFARADGWHADPAVVARTTKDQPGFNFDESRVRPYTLPDVMRGGAIRTPDAWQPRRAAILNLFRDDVYGRSPGRPEHLSFEKIEENAHAMDDAATLERIAIVSRQRGREHRFVLTLFVPNARPKAPVFLLINNRAASNTDPTRGENPASGRPSRSSRAATGSQRCSTAISRPMTKITSRTA